MPSTRTTKSDPSNREGENYKALQIYVATNFPESDVQWTTGDPTIRGSEYQAHVVHSGSRLVKGSRGLWLQTLNGETVEKAAGNLLNHLKRLEKEGMEELKAYVKEEGYEEKGFIIEVEGPSKTDQLYRVSVHLSVDFCKRTNRNRFILGTAIRKSTGIAAREVLKVLEFKKSKGYMWADDTLFKEAAVKYTCEATAAALRKKQSELRTKGKDLTRAEIDKINENTYVPHVKWLGQKFQGPPDFYSGQLPELSKEIHKVLKANGYVLDPVPKQKASSKSKGKEKTPPKPLIAYEAVETYERICKEKAERKAEAKENSRISNFSKRLGFK